MGWILSSPYLAWAFVFFLIPLVWAVWLSGMDWNLMALDKTWVGFGNFVEALTSPKVHAAFINSLKYIAFLMPMVMVSAMLTALLLNALPRGIKGFYSVSFFIPYLTSGVAVSVFIRYFFSYSSMFNIFLREKLDVDITWFQSPLWAFLIIIGVIAWKLSGYYALIFLAALEALPDEIMDAAEVDGANIFQKFFQIKLPMMISSISTVAVLLTGVTFGIFSEPYLLTGGGPSGATTTWYLELFNASFVRFESGLGASIAILNAVEIFIAIRLITMLADRLDHNK